MSASDLTLYDTTSTIIEFTVTFINSSSLSFEYCSMKYPVLESVQNKKSVIVVQLSLLEADHQSC